MRELRPDALAFLAMAVVANGAISYLAFSPERSGSVFFWLLATGPTVTLAAIAAAWAAREGLLGEWFGPRWGDFSRGLLGAATLYGLAWAFVRVIVPVGSDREIWLVSLYAQIGDPRVLQAHAAAVAVAVLAAAVAEELVWRGMVTQIIADRVGSRAAWIWAALLYALAYVPTAFALRAVHGPNPVLVVTALGGGLLWGGMARRFGRLAPSVLAHALFDWTVLMMFPLWGGAWRR